MTSSKASKAAKGATEITETSSGASELTDSDAAAAGLPRHSFLSRLYTGTGAFEVVGRRRLWFGISGAIVAVAILSIALRGFTFGIDFNGGTTVSMPAAGTHGTVHTAQVQEVFRKTLGTDPESVVVVGNGAAATVQIRSETLTNDQTTKLRNALFDAFGPKGADGKPSKQAISDSQVSETWGDQITDKALIALVVFLALVGLYITVRYERYMTLAAIAAMFFDLTVTAGVYSLVGFEVTPATVIGLLTILGFSLYDTVIVFDKVEENTRDFQHTNRRTFAEQANLAINQTFMRSINTSLIGVLPVLALMVVAVWLLGVGTLKDLALVQLVGILVGTYSSIFVATPLLVTLRERTELVRTHTRRVLKRRGAPPTTPPSLPPGPGTRPPRPSGSRGRPGPRRASRRRVRPGVRPASGTSAGGRHVAIRIGRRGLTGWVGIGMAVLVVAGVALAQRRGRDRLRGRRTAEQLQPQHRRRRRLGRSAGVRPHPRRVQLSRPRRANRPRPRLRHRLGGRRHPAGARLPDRRQRRLLRRQAGDLRRHRAGLGRPVRPVPGVQRRHPGRLPRHRQRRMHARAEEGPGVLRPRPRHRRLQPAVHRDHADAVARHRRPAQRRRHRGPAQPQRAAGGADRQAVEHHLGPQTRAEG